LATSADLSAQNQTLVFSAMGDIPYSSSEVPVLQQQIRDHNTYSPAEFMVHIGDIKSGTSSCAESVYRDMAGYLEVLRVPTYIIPGDNEWVDCSSPSQAWKYWGRYFTDFESRFCGTPATEHQGARHENWAFTTKGVLCVGINLVAPSSSVDQTQWNARLQQDADWVSQQLRDKGAAARCAVLFAHDGPGDSRQSLFYNQFRAAAATFGKPLLLLHGDDHSWRLDRPFPEQNVLRLQVDNGVEENPVQVTVTLDAQNPFTFVRDPWHNNPQPFNAPPCGGPIPAVSIGDARVVEGDAGTVEAVFTVSLVNGSGGTVSVHWSTSPGTAAANTDYEPASGTVQLSGSTDSRTIAVAVRGDEDGEPDETFRVDLDGVVDASLADAQGIGTIENDDASTEPLRFTPVYDAHVASSSPSSNYGAATELRSKSDSSIYNAYLKFEVAGVAGTVQSASLELYCTNASDNAGLVYLAANDYRNTTTPWVESSLNYDNAPAIAGTPLNSPVPAVPGTWIRFDVTGAMTGNGTYTFAFRNPSGDSVYFSSKEGANDPVLVIATSSTPPAEPVAPIVSAFSPVSGLAGTEVTITGSHFTGTNAVAFAGVPAGFVVDSDTRIRATAPAGVATGRIVVTNVAGSDSSNEDFVVTASTTLRFEPLHDTQVNSSSPSSRYGSSTTLRTKSDSSIYNAYLKFAVQGVAGPVQSATLELYCTDESDNAGLVHLVSNDYRDTTTPWLEGGLTFNNAPAFAGMPLNTPVSAVPNTWLQFDVTAAVGGDGTYSFGIRNPSGNSVYYSSKEGGHRPVLVLRVGSAIESATATAKSTAGGPMPPQPALGIGRRAGHLEFSRHFPNPTRGLTTLEYSLPQPGPVTLTVFDVTGSVVRRMNLGTKPAGAHRAVWDGTDDLGRRAPNGVYFLRLQAGVEARQRRVTLVR
jgi:hypothetical protein